MKVLVIADYLGVDEQVADILPVLSDWVTYKQSVNVDL